MSYGLQWDLPRKCLCGPNTAPQTRASREPLKVILSPGLWALSTPVKCPDAGEPCVGQGQLTVSRCQSLGQRASAGSRAVGGTQISGGTESNSERLNCNCLRFSVDVHSVPQERDSETTSSKTQRLKENQEGSSGYKQWREETCGQCLCRQEIRNTNFRRATAPVAELHVPACSDQPRDESSTEASS